MKSLWKGPFNDTVNLRRMLRACWLALTVLAILITCIGVPARARELASLEVPPAQVFELGSPLAALIIVIECVTAAFMIGVANVIFWRLSMNRMAVLLALFYLCAGVALPSMSDALTDPRYSSLDSLFNMPVAFFRLTAVIVSLLLFFVFPTGQFVPRWTRTIALFWIVLNSIWFLFPNLPFNVQNGPIWRLTPYSSYAVAMIWFGSGVYAQIRRFQRTKDVVERQQIKWVALSLLVMFAGGALYYGIWLWSYQESVLQMLWFQKEPYHLYFFTRLLTQSLLMAILPTGFVFVAILQYRLFDLPIFINRSLLSLFMTMMVVGFYVIVVIGLGRLLAVQNSLPLSLTATLIIGFIFQPVRDWTQIRLDQLMFGNQSQPMVVLGEVGKQLDATLTPVSVLPGIIDTIRTALKLPHVAIEISVETGLPPYTEEGQSVGKAERFPLINRAEIIGYLLVSPRSPLETLNSADRVVLNMIAQQVSATIYALSLSHDLQISRQRIVTAREEERQRLRRDLHDGLGPALATLSLQAEVARDLLYTRPNESEVLITEIIKGTQTAIIEVRRVVYALRPPALDDLGLSQALHEQAMHYSQNGLRITVSTPDDLSFLSAAVEAAIYRIVQESLTNVVRHAQALNCSVELQINEVITLRIHDDGRGIPENRRAGVGLNAMHERAAELGGSCELTSEQGQGTSITVRLPLEIG